MRPAPFVDCLTRRRCGVSTCCVSSMQRGHGDTPFPWTLGIVARLGSPQGVIEGERQLNVWCSFMTVRRFFLKVYHRIKSNAGGG